MQERTKILINIHGFNISVEGLNEELYKKVRSDFSYFLVDRLEGSQGLAISWIEEEPHGKIPKNLYPVKQSANSMTYDSDGIRYNDYYSKATTVLDYKNRTFTLFSKNQDLVYELIFLIIQSRSGKYLDSIGFHKIHACAFVYDKTNYILILPSKGGKSTTLLHLLKKYDVDIISDDSPIVDSKGGLYPYPLRLGVEKRQDYDGLFGLDKDAIYDFTRQHYSKKYLLPISALRNNISVASNTKVIFGFRGSFEKPKKYKISKVKAFQFMWYHMIIGVGLPMIIEYFIENNIKDYLLNFRILISRIRNAIILIMKSNCSSIELSSSIEENVKELLR
ncbi:hypothetical protein [Halobacteriovorax sp. HLS]|uniref:hypothetical protein n=1 Tax=Halobacteriovorax sp. HLS TaxID=2234000 RepID=UPI000FDBD3DA|nr:hypothetical protein [Halobacteriovorax sp. HLS]